MLFFLFCVFLIILFQLQKSVVEMSQTKEDMKSLQKDLANADKEISVSQIKARSFFPSTRLN